MIDHEKIVASAEKPLADFCKKMRTVIGDWGPYRRASEKILAGESVADGEVQPEMRFLLDWTKLIMEVTRQGEWDWNSPEVQAVYKGYAESNMYKILADAVVDIVMAILKTGQIGTVVEVGTGPGKITEVLCRQMVENDISTPVIISDGAPGIKDTGESLRRRYPRLSVSDFVWDIRQDPPEALVKELKPPVLMYERFCIPYGGYETINRIAPVADILLLMEDFNLTDEKEAYDIIFEKIGLDFFTCHDTRNYLEKHFSFIHPFDTSEATNIPDTCFFILAAK